MKQVHIHCLSPHATGTLALTENILQNNEVCSQQYSIDRGDFGPSKYHHETDETNVFLITQ